MYDYYTERVYELKEHNAQNYDDALKRIKEWDYSSDAPIALGTFYKKEAPTFETSMTEGKAKEVSRDLGIKELLKQYI
jgi:2-oxoglutarate ferredoxin oxidoreductase subunit beta